MGMKSLAIFVGLVVDIGLSLGLGVGMGIVLALYLTQQGVPASELATRLDAQHLQNWPAVMLAGMGLGAFGSLVGGFVTGWMARSSRIACGAIMGVLSCLFGAFFWSQDPLWYNCAGVVSTLVMTTGGAALAQLAFGKHPPPPAPFFGPVV